MERLGLPLLYEIFRYLPILIRTALCLNSTMQKRLQSHPEFIHTLIEDLYRKGARELTFGESLDLVQSNPKNRLYALLGQSYTVRIIQLSPVPQLLQRKRLPSSVKEHGMVWAFMSSTEILLTGGRFHGSAEIIDILNWSKTPTTPMACARINHGIATYQNIVYVFGGH